MSWRIYLYPWELRSMPEYSTTLPTGTTTWKMWKRNVLARGEHGGLVATDEWLVGQYVPCDDPNYIGIRWHEVHLKAGPEPRIYRPPDWSNMDRYRRERDLHSLKDHVTPP